MGDTGVSLMSRDGDILASAEIPQKPISRPIIGDFDSDGVTDVIICMYSNIYIYIYNLLNNLFIFYRIFFFI